MEKLRRSEAVKLGHKKYFNGKPCKRGHVALRYTSNTHCVECTGRYYETNKDEIKAYQKRYLLHNPDKKIQTWKRWYKENSDRHKARNKKYVEENQEKVLAARKEHYRKNSEAIKQKKEAWRKRNWGHVLLKTRQYSQKRRAAKLGAGGIFTKRDLENKLKEQNGLCNICAADIRNKFHADHIKPLSKGGDNWPENIQLLCPFCNLSKGAKYDGK